MIVGTKYIDLFVLGKHTGSAYSLQKYVNSLMPEKLKGIKEIEGNQRFWVALHLRKIVGLDYAKRKELENYLTRGVEVVGVLNEVYDLNDLIMKGK